MSLPGKEAAPSLLKPVISRLGIPRKFSTLVLTSSAKPPETNQTEVRREGACTGHHAPTSRPSGKGGEPSGPGGLLARPAGHVPCQGEPAASHETCENVCYTENSRSEGVSLAAHTPGLTQYFAAVAHTGGSRAARPTVLMPTDARACWAGGCTALPAGGRRQPASAPLLQPFVRAARTCTGGERSGGPSFGVAGRSTGLFRWRIGQASCPQCPWTALRTNAIPP